MVDVKKMKLKIEHYPNWMECMLIKLDLVKTNSNSKHQYYAGELYFHDDKSSADFDKDRYLVIELIKNKNYFGITISGSIRSWYFGLNSVNDFSKSKFDDCISLLSEKLLVTRLHLSNAKIMELIWEAKIGFRKEQGNFMSCIFDHKTLKNKSTLGKTKIKFFGNDKKFLITKKNPLLEIANKAKFDFYVHFQLAFKNISNDNYLVNNARYPKDILKNWDDMVDEWESQMNNLIIVNSFSPEISDYLKNSNMTKMNGYLIYVGIKHYGLENFRQLMTENLASKKLYEYRQKYIDIYEQFEDLHTPNYRSYFITNVELTAEKLKK